VNIEGSGSREFAHLSTSGRLDARPNHIGNPSGKTLDPETIGHAQTLRGSLIAEILDAFFPKGRVVVPRDGEALKQGAGGGTLNRPSEPDDGQPRR
jgi:hypothetical protein